MNKFLGYAVLTTIILNIITNIFLDVARRYITMALVVLFDTFSIIFIVICIIIDGIRSNRVWLEKVQIFFLVYLCIYN